MNNEMTQDEIQALAQKLVDIKRDIKRLTDETNVAKLDLYDNARDGIQCNGGRVKFMDRQVQNRFKQEKLKVALLNKNLTETEIDEILESSRELVEIDENIYVYLD
jgi:hypothetical protein